VTRLHLRTGRDVAPERKTFCSKDLPQNEAKGKTKPLQHTPERYL